MKYTSDEIKEHYLESLNKAVSFIENNLDQKILLKDISKEALLSEFHFHRLFKALTGETVKEFTNRLKLERAANKLKNSSSDIGNIALESGFESHETFSRAFKKHFGISPIGYRELTDTSLRFKKADYAKRAIQLPDLNIEEPIIKKVSDLDVAYIRHTGSYNKVAASFQRLMFWAIRHLVLKLKPTTIGIVHDNPELTQEELIRFDACILLNKPIQPKGEIGYKHIKGGKYAVFRYKGPYDNFYTVYDYIYNVCLFEKGWELRDQPALEWYIKSPPFYKPESYVTDFMIPIK